MHHLQVVLSRLDLLDNAVGDETAQAFAEAFPARGFPLVYLGLGAKITSAGFALLGHGLASNEQVQCRGGRCTCALLGHADVVLTLPWCSRCQLWVLVWVLVWMLVWMPQLGELDVSGNEIDAEVRGKTATGPHT